MKAVTKKILVACAIVICACAMICIPVIHHQIMADAVTYRLGSKTVQAERLEAENATTVGKVSGPSATPNFVSGGKVLELSNSGGSATYTVKMEQAGDYVVKCAYFTNSSGAKLSVSANSGTAVVTDALLRTGGWASTGKILCRYAHVTVSLNAGENTVVVKQGASSGTTYVNLDFIELYPKDSVFYYETERNGNPTVAGAFALNERIEAEYGYNLADAGVSTIEYSGNCISGWLMKQNTSALQYAVEVPKAGEYYLQIVGSAAGAFGETTQMEYALTVNGTALTLTDFPLATYQGGGNVVQTASYHTVTLQQGVNLIVLNAITSTKQAHTDFFTVFEKGNEIGRTLELERYVDGLAKVIKSGHDYPEISGDVVEFSTQAESTIRVPVTVDEAGGYDLYLRGWTGTANAKVNLSLNGTQSVLSVAQTGWVTSSGLQAPKDNVYRIELQEGANELVFTQSGSIYVDMDWIYLSKEKVSQAPSAQGGYVVKVGEELSVGEGVTVADQSLATVANGVLTAIKAGTTTLKTTVTMDNGYSYARTYPLTVEKIAYDGTDLVAEDVTVPYSGAPVYYNGASAPQGWRVTYANNDEPLQGVGEKTVYVKFSHDVYEDVIKQATLTVTKANYAGEDLVADDVSGFYNGTVYAVVPTAPEGWEITTSGNSRRVVGESIVQVAFTHPYYNDVVKTATISVAYAAQARAVTAKFTDTLALQFSFDIDQAVFADATAKVVFRTAQGQKTVALSEGREREGQYVFTYAVSPREYGKVVYARIDTALGTCPEMGGSIASYVDHVLAHATEAEYEDLVPIVTALRDYCTAVKEYLGYLPATPAYPSVTAQMLAPFALQTEGTLPADVKLLGVKVVFESELRLQLYFTATKTSVQGAVAVSGEKNTYCVEVTVKMSELGLMHEFVMDGGSVRFSVLTFAEGVLREQSSSVALQNLARALYNYDVAMHA